jgi:hypothetical protein
MYSNQRFVLIVNGETVFDSGPCDLDIEVRTDMDREISDRRDNRGRRIESESTTHTVQLTTGLNTAGTQLERNWIAAERNYREGDRIEADGSGDWAVVYDDDLVSRFDKQRSVAIIAGGGKGKKIPPKPPEPQQVTPVDKIREIDL